MLTPQTLYFVHQASGHLPVLSPSKGHPEEHWHLDLGEVSRVRLSGAGPVVLTSFPGGSVCSILSITVAPDHTSPQREAEKPLVGTLSMVGERSERQCSVRLANLQYYLGPQPLDFEGWAAGYWSSR